MTDCGGYRQQINNLIDEYINHILNFESDVFSAKNLNITKEEAEKMVFIYLSEDNMELNLDKYDLAHYYNSYI